MIQIQHLLPLIIQYLPMPCSLNWTDIDPIYKLDIDLPAQGYNGRYGLGQDMANKQMRKWIHACKIVLSLNVQ